VRVQGKRVGSLAEMGATAKDVHGITFNEDRRPTEDRTPPAVIATLGFAVAGGPQLIQIAFDEQIDPEIAAKPATWTPRPDEVRLDPGLRHVTLVLPASAERPTVSFLGLADLHGNILAAQPTIAWSDAFDAAAALPPLQGLAGFWFEQFNPEPVMTWSGRPDLMQTPTHWLISWLPDAAGAMAWTGHDANLLIDGSRMQVSERFQPVRCWRAPLGGRVRITGTVTPVHGPLRARITRLAAPRTGAEGETLWGWQDIVAATGHGVEVTVQRDDLIRCSLAAPEGGRPGGQIADWAPRISYLAIP
jgi:hypothetical protein